MAAANLAPALTGGRLAMMLIATGLLQYLSNEIAFCALTESRHARAHSAPDPSTPSERPLLRALRALRARATDPRRRGPCRAGTLSMIHPITYALSNTLKRSIVVGASLLFFRQTLPASGALGAALAICGALGYSLAIQQQQAAAVSSAAAEVPDPGRRGRRRIKAR